MTLTFDYWNLTVDVLIKMEQLPQEDQLAFWEELKSSSICNVVTDIYEEYVLLKEISIRIKDADPGLTSFTFVDPDNEDLSYSVDFTTFHKTRVVNNVDTV